MENAAGLTEAWATAEAALPAGWLIADLSLLLPHGSAFVRTWNAEASCVISGRWARGTHPVTGQGHTPEEALLDLARLLKARR